MKLLTIVPVLSSPQWVERCLKQIQSDLLVIDNGSGMEVKEVIKDYRKVVNDKNIYVNPVWNQAFRIFLCSDYTHLAIISSDIIMMPGWEKFVKKHNRDNIIMLPDTVKEHFKHSWTNKSHHIECWAGMFLFFDKKMVKICFPIPETVKIWFGDNWIQKKLERAGYVSTLFWDLHVIHGNSQSVRSLGKEGIDIIEQDKIEWQKLIEAGKI